MSESKTIQNRNLVLMIYLHDWQETLLAEFWTLWQPPSRALHEWRDGVFLLAQNAILFDQAKAHDVLVRVCQSLLAKNRAYLLIPVSSTDGWIAAGIPSAESKAILEHLSVPNPGFSPSS
jgi:hypothetical protein